MIGGLLTVVTLFFSNYAAPEVRHLISLPGRLYCEYLEKIDPLPLERPDMPAFERQIHCGFMALAMLVFIHTIVAICGWEIIRYLSNKIRKTRTEKNTTMM